MAGRCWSLPDGYECFLVNRSSGAPNSLESCSPHPDAVRARVLATQKLYHRPYRHAPPRLDTHSPHAPP
eukprot:2176915-Prymnesium_polylepis.1